jgi:hypothetical protein
MTRYILAGLVAIGTAGFLGTVSGCDDTVAKHETVQTKDDGTTVHKKDEVKEKADGTVVHEETKSVDKP